MTPPAFVAGSFAPHFRLKKRLPIPPSPCVRGRGPATPVTMGRRSAKIARRKDAQTLARTKIFARIGKRLTMAAKAGGADVIANKALAEAIEEARANSFPKDTMEKCIARATSGDQADFKASTFEAYGHGGVGVYIDVLTDNSNRAAADIRTAINKGKMKIASPGSVAFNFERMGVVRLLSENVSDAEQLLMGAIDAGAEECDLDPADEAMYRIITNQSSLISMRNSLKESGYKLETAEVEMVPKMTMPVSDDDMELNLNAIDTINALEDVDGVYHNGVFE